MNISYIKHKEPAEV